MAKLCASQQIAGLVWSRQGTKQQDHGAFGHYNTIYHGAWLFYKVQNTNYLNYSQQGKTKHVVEDV